MLLKGKRDRIPTWDYINKKPRREKERQTRTIKAAMNRRRKKRNGASHEKKEPKQKHSHEQHQKKKKKEKKKKNLAGQTPKCKPQEGWIGVTGITGGQPAFYQNTFSFGGQMGTGVLELLGRESRIGGVAQTRTRLLGKQTLRPQAARRVCHPDFPPKLATNSVFKPASGCARPSCGSKVTLV